MPTKSLDRRKRVQNKTGERLPKGVVSLGPDKGYRVARQVDGKRTSVRRPTVDACRDWLRDDKAVTVSTTSKTMTFGQWADKWIELVKVEPKKNSSDDKSVTTAWSYETRLRVYEPLRKDPLASITYAKIKAAEQSPGLRGRIRAGSTLHQSRLVLNTCLHRAVRKKLIPSNPLDAEDVAGLAATPRYAKRKLNDDQRAMLYNELKRHRHAVLLCMILSSGARHGEIRGLHWQDVRLTGDHAAIDIHYTSQQVRRLGTIMKASAKTGNSVRDNLELDVHTSDILREWHTAHGSPTSGPLFPSPFTKRLFDCAACQQRHVRVISAGVVEAAFREVTTQTGLKLPGQRLGTHNAGRHSLASTEGFRRDPAKAAKWLGHDVRTYLKTYVIVDNQDNTLAATMGDELFGTREHPASRLMVETVG